MAQNPVINQETIEAMQSIIDSIDGLSKIFRQTRESFFRIVWAKYRHMWE
jgi:hypothetical protein